MLPNFLILASLVIIAAILVWSIRLFIRWVTERPWQQHKQSKMRTLLKQFWPGINTLIKVK